jgi:carboxyl-terminal processing protease
MRKAWFVLLGAAGGVALTVAATQPPAILTGAAAKPAPYGEEFRLLGLFAGAYEQVRAHYVEKPDESRMVASAISGMLTPLENSYYLDAKTFDSKSFDSKTFDSKTAERPACSSPACGDVGVAIAMQDGFATVETAIDDSPAAKAGILTGDIIAGIDNESLDGLGYYQISEKLRGQVGTPVRLDIVRPGRAKTIAMALVRDNIRARSVRSHIEGDDIGYIRIGAFNENTAEQLRKAIEDIAAHIAPDKLKGYVVDLRNNPGGLQDAAIAAADAFLEDGEIASIRARKSDEVRHFRAQPGDLTHGKKLIALINAGSASTAEVVAGALQDNHRATLVGTRTFGEGSIASLIPLGARQGALRLATGHYVTPSGRVIETNGIAPDVEAPQNLPDDLKAEIKSEGAKRPALQSYIPPDPAADKALTVAYDLLRK